MQAPQRERVSLVVRGSVLLQSNGDVLKSDSSWKRKIKGNNLESVPRLLWLLEPKIIFAHAKVTETKNQCLRRLLMLTTLRFPLWDVQAKLKGQNTESQYCQGMFLEGFHKGGGRVSTRQSMLKPSQDSHVPHQ